MLINATYVVEDIIIHDVNSLLNSFGLEGRPEVWEGNNPHIFPYHWTEESMKPVFDYLLDTREHYYEFLDRYLANIERVEKCIRALKAERGRRYYDIDNYLTQSYAAKLGNLATRLYWLRNQARTWRRNNLKREHEMLDVVALRA